MAQPGDGWRPFAGGTDLMVLLEAGKLEHRKFVSLWGREELRGISVNDSHLTLGALTTYTEVQRHPVLAAEFPLLVRAARETGGVATQNRGTLGGNVANASPAADSPPALLAYDAELELISLSKSNGGAGKLASRTLPYLGFHTGYKKVQITPGEIIARIRLPRRARNAGHPPALSRHYYRKVGTRRAQAISKVCLAGTLALDGATIRDVRIALGSVAPVPLRCVATEALLRGARLNAETIHAARESLAREIAPIDDMRSSARYRLRVAQNLLAEFLASSPQ